MRARKVDEFMSTATGREMTWLELLITESSGGFFGNIWSPAREYDPTTNKMSDTYTYFEVGLQPDETAQLYWTQYSGNYLIGGKKTIDEDFEDLVKRCRSIFLKNRGKYRKLVELEGLTWNPLWNVDGTELHQIIEQHADEVTKDAGSAQSLRGQNIKRTHDVAAYDSGVKTEWEETQTGESGTQTATASSNIGDITVSSESGSVPSVSESEASASSAVNIRSHASFEYAVPIKDTAFGTALTGGDTLHTEKTLRQGNIGVTKTTELIRDARDVVAYSIVQEFFNDINEYILVGIYF